MNERYQIVQTGNPPLAPQMVAQPLPTPMPMAAGASDPGASIDIAAIIDAFRRRWWLVASLVLIGAAVSGLYLMRTSPVYESSATVEVAQGKLRMLNIEELNPEDLSNLEVLKTMEQSLSSSTLLLRVVEACGLRDDPDFKPPGDGQYSDALLADILGSMVHANLRRGTRLIDVVVRDTDPERARRIAASVVTEFDRLEIEGGKSLASDAHGSLAEEAKRLQEQLERTEAKLQAYREQHRTVALEGKEAVLEEKAKAVHAELAKTKAERMRMEADLAQLDAGGVDSSAAALALPSVATRPEVIALRGKVTEKESEFAMVKKRYLYKHPTYKKVASELEEMRAGLGREALLAARGLRNTRDALLAKEMSLDEELRKGREELLELTRVLVPYKTLVREVEGDRSLYESVRTRQREAAATGAVERGTLTLKDAPLAATYPIWPRSKLILGLGVFAGLGLGCFLVLAGGIFDRSFRSQVQAERVLAMPLLAELPRGDIGFEPGGEAGECFRSLRASLGFVGRGSHARVFVFAGAESGEDAAICAANTAAAFARQGQRTLLIDGDLRTPALDQIVLGRRMAPGLAQYLNTIGSKPGQVVNTTPVENLLLLGAGATVPNPGELLSDARLAALLEESRQWFHRVVISAPALDGVSDGLLLARHADSVCLVVEAGKTPRRDALRACGLLSMAGAPPVGFVLKGGRARPGAKKSAATREHGREASLQEA